MRNVTVCFAFREGPLQKAVTQVFSLTLGYTSVPNPEDAEVILTDNEGLYRLYTPEQVFVVMDDENGKTKDLPENVHWVGASSLLVSVMEILASRTKIDWMPPEKDEPTINTSKATRILVVDDSVKHRNGARRQLTDYNLKVVKNFAEAAASLEQERFNYVLTDLKMPEARRGALGRPRLGVTDALGFLVATTAALHKVPMVAIVTDANHHSDQFSAEFDILGREPMRMNDTWVHFIHASLAFDGSKDWGKALQKLMSLTKMI